jgi:putative transposase
MYRILDANQEVRERRNQLRHPIYQKPELLATRPNELWSWDITKLLGPSKWTYFYLYVILDVYSRYVVGWMVALQEATHLAELLFLETCQKHNIQPGQLTLHADRGNPMNSKPFAMLLADLGVTKTHSRPHVSNDNPYSEAHFRTLKYCPAYPQRFGSLADARTWSKDFFQWYNLEHHHSGIALLTRQTSIMVAQIRCFKPASWSCRPLMLTIQNALSMDCPSHWIFHRQSGLIHPS